MILPGSGYVPDAPSATTTLANTQGAIDGDGLSFSDVLDAINPLQHIPIVSTIYREATGSDIKALPNMIGGAIFGGVFGLIGAAVDSVVKEASGATIGHHLLAAVGLADDKAPEVTVTDLSTGQVVPNTDDAAPKPTASAIDLRTASVMLDEANGQPADFRAERDNATLLALASGTARNFAQPAPTQQPAAPQHAVAQAAVAKSNDAPAPQATAAAQQPTDFFRSLQRANFAHQEARPLQTLSTIETTPRRTRTTAAGATANNAVATPSDMPAPPAAVGTPTSILPQAQAASVQAPSVAQAQATLQANPDAFRNDMMAALQKYEAMRNADSARQLSITQ